MKNKANIKDLYTEDKEVFAVDREFWKHGARFYSHSTTVGFFGDIELAKFMAGILNTYEATDYGDFYTCYSVRVYGEGFCEVCHEPEYLGFDENALIKNNPCEDKPSLYERLVDYMTRNEED